jgi:cytochrome P450
MPPQVIFREPDDINAILSAPEKTLHPGKGGDTIAPIVGRRSFMLADDETHRVGRKAIRAALGSQVVEEHTEMIVEATGRTLANWPCNRPIPIYDNLRALTLEVILRSLAGHLNGVLSPTLAQLHRDILEMLTITANPMFVESRLRHGPGKIVWSRFLGRRQRIDESLMALIKNGTLRPLRGDAIADDQGTRVARDDAMSLILAGHETTAAQLAWAFQLLAHHPLVRDRLIREIEADTGDDYLTATIQEVLRHRCAFVFAIPRAVVQPVKIGKWTYAPPTQLLACIYLLHHDSSIYPDPHVFRPERFLDVRPDPQTWIPWGGGRKRCPGLHLAMLEMKVILRTVLRERTPCASARRMERPRWRSVIVAPHAGSRVVLASRR